MIGPLPYIGGKRRLAARLLPLIPEHLTYVEPFAGGAQLFFRKPRSRVEVLNDLDGELVTFLRIVQRHRPELLRLLRYLAPSRALFAQFAAQDPRQLTDVERACRFFYLQKNAFGGRRKRSNFHYCVTKPPNYTPARLAALLAATADRLARVQLECWPYERVLERYDRPTTFFYCDPPYIGADLYQHNLSAAQFEELAAHLAALQGRFLLSLNDSPQARAWFGRFVCREITLTYTSIRRPRPFQELLFANYPLPAVEPALTSSL